MKGLLFYFYSIFIVKREYYFHKNADRIQRKLLQRIIRDLLHTQYGLDFNTKEISNENEFRLKLPLVSYEDILPYIEKIKLGEKNILTTQQIKYLLLTSGTTSGVKYIPITNSGIQHQINAAKKLLCFYSFAKKNGDFLNGKMLFLQGSPLLETNYSIPSGRLSGVVYHHVPKFFLRNRLPSFHTNIITDWQKKIRSIAEECIDQNLTVIGGIPPWCIQFFELLCSQKKTQSIKEIFPNLKLYIHGGVDFQAYEENLNNLVTKNVDLLQTYPASEGFFAIQDLLHRNDMLLLLHQGIFYEFIPLEYTSESQPKTLTLTKVEKNMRYELVVTTDSGLYRYRLGDIVEFTELSPYRIKMVGRTSQFISAFGEHVISYEIETTISKAIRQFHLEIVDYHVSPNVSEMHYEWRIEWSKIPTNISEIEAFLDDTLCELNKYYHDLMEGETILGSKIISLSAQSFHKLRLQEGKEGGQNKVIRLSNSTIYANKLDKCNTN